MKGNRLIVLILLLVFSGGLLAGPHPCEAQETPPEPARESKPACHGHEAAPVSHQEQSASPAKGHEDDCCSGGQGSACRHACHMVALVQVRVSLSAVQPQARMAASTFDRSLPLFAPPIDHIPLV